MKLVRPVLIAALLIAHSSAHAASFDCSKGRSLAEKIICHDPALSRLDDTLGQLYWKARRKVSDRRGFITDSDNKWAWRETHCRDAACLGTWYATRIDELRQLIASMQAGAGAATAAAEPPHSGDVSSPAQSEPARQPSMSAPSAVDAAMLQCTAAHPGLAIGEPCSSVLRQNGSPWKYRPHGGDWFCGVAMLGRS
ncbi:lysozyme inhibitor LprI family protein [Paraburkholderia phenoliruptrix]|uniref:lysozyme inhibitor LprI family protein n=1 Tax=Paraburkholderia phenoliruptrix TaxID=252970 RepID=UPI0001C0327E